MMAAGRYASLGGAAFEHFNALCEGSFSAKRFAVDFAFTAAGEGLGMSGQFTTREQFVNDQVFGICNDAVKSSVSN